MKKLKLQCEDVADGDSTSSNGEAEERTCCADVDRASGSGELRDNQLEDMGLPEHVVLMPTVHQVLVNLGISS